MCENKKRNYDPLCDFTQNFKSTYHSQTLLETQNTEMNKA